MRHRLRRTKAAAKASPHFTPANPALPAGAFEGLLGAPFGDLGVVAAEQDVGHLQALELGGLGGVRGFEQAFGAEGCFGGAEVVAEHAVAACSLSLRNPF